MLVCASSESNLRKYGKIYKNRALLLELAKWGLGWRVIVRKFLRIIAVRLSADSWRPASKWRLVLLVFTAVYASLLLLNLGYSPILWDEMPHLHGGLLLARGQTHAYFDIYGYYSPLFDFVTAGYYQLFGVSVAAGRLVAVMFSILAIWVVFEFANRAYGPKIALLSSIILGTMPGFIWLSRTAMLETVLVFFFALILFFFLVWIRKGQNKALILSCVALGVGFFAKYQVLVAIGVMVVGILVLGRDKLRWRFSKFLLVPLTVILIMLPWFVVLYQNNDVNNFVAVFNVVREGHEERALYSIRFPPPVFYLVEMTLPLSDVPVYPIFLPVFILGLVGLGLFAWRRKTEDKFFLTWFVVVYVFFTIIPNRQWRYVFTLFPVLAVSAASFVFFAYGKLAEAWKKVQVSSVKKRLLKVASALLISFAVASVAFSSYSAYQMIARDQIYIPIKEATNYAAQNLRQNESIMVLAPFNLFDRDMVKFYLESNGSKPNQVLQYPELPVDAFKPDFNMTALIAFCGQQSVKYVFLYEYGGEVPYFQSNMTAMQVFEMLGDSGRFVLENRVGSFPRTITIFEFRQ
jgi:Dolichyl-phosphate-mannose-protein mannosyltransferase